MFLVSMFFWVFSLIFSTLLNAPQYIEHLSTNIGFLIFVYSFLKFRIDEIRIMLIHTKFRDDEFDKTVLLTPSERNVYELMVIGKSYIEISEELHVTVDTIKFHKKNIFKKLNVKSKEELSN